MDDTGILIGITFFVVLILVEGLLLGFGAAIQNLPLHKNDESENEQSAREKKIMAIAEKPKRFVYTVHCVTAVLFALFGSLLAKIFVALSGLSFIREGNDILGVNLVFGGMVFIAVCLGLVVFISFGVALPKKLGTHQPGKWTKRCYLIVRICMILFAPVIYLAEGICKGVLLLTGGKAISDEADVTEEEILNIVNEGHEQGVLLASEAEMISNIMEYGDKEAKDIMTYRNNIHAFDASLTLGEVTKQILEEHYSRFPVYEDTLDQVIGIVYLKDVMRLQGYEKMQNLPIGSMKKLLRKPVFIPETKNVDDILKMMQSTKNQMVIVIDEYGQTTGLLALEDILEEIVGNIQDEFDEETKFVISSKKGEEADEYLIDASAHLEDLEDFFGITFEEEEYETLNGFMIRHLEHIPEKNEVFSFPYKNCIFAISETGNRRVETVLVSVKKDIAEVDENSKK